MSPIHSQAWIAYPHATEFVLEDIIVDTPKHDELLIQTQYCGLCHSDQHFLHDSLLLDRVLDGHYQGVVVGHEASGIVLATGPDVTDIHVGDHVTTAISGYCHTCIYCLRGQKQACTREKLHRHPQDTARVRRAHDLAPLATGFNIGGFSKHIIISEKNCSLIPKDLDLQLAACMGCAALTMYGTIKQASLKRHDNLAIIGAGGLGLIGTEIARAQQCPAIDIYDTQQSKIDYALSLGAQQGYLIQSNQTEPPSQKRYSHVFELVGGKASQTTVNLGLQLLDKAGTLYIVGVPDSQSQLDNLSLSSLFFLNQSIVTSIMGNIDFKQGIGDLIRWQREGVINLNQFLDPIDFYQLNEGYQNHQRIRHILDVQSTQQDKRAA